jgi:hypothetical protein
MKMSYSYLTTLLVSVAGGTERELTLRLRYTVTPGSEDYWDGQMWQQGWAAEVELSEALVELPKPREWVAVPEWIFSILYGDTDLQAELLSNAADSDEYHRDQAADMRREELRSERA